LTPPVEIAYSLLLQTDGTYQVRVVAGSAAPIIVGNFPSKREAQAWIKADSAPLPARPSGEGTPDPMNRARIWRAKAEECRTAAETMRNEQARNTFLNLARNYDALADLANGLQQSARRKREVS
jgi:hypothetical protein